MELYSRILQTSANKYVLRIAIPSVIDLCIKASKSKHFVSAGVISSLGIDKPRES